MSDETTTNATKAGYVHWYELGQEDASHAAITELRALKARRCDGCDWVRITDYGHTVTHLCGLAGDDGPGDGPMQATSPGNYEEALIVAPDHACNAWQPPGSRGREHAQAHARKPY